MEPVLRPPPPPLPTTSHQRTSYRIRRGCGWSRWRGSLGFCIMNSSCLLPKYVLCILYWHLTFLFILGYIQGWEFAHGFSERFARFCPKISEWGIRSKNERLTHLLIFGEQLKQFSHIAHFCEWPEQFTHIAHQIKKSYKKHTKKHDFRFFIF